MKYLKRMVQLSMVLFLIGMNIMIATSTDDIGVIGLNVALHSPSASAMSINESGDDCIRHIGGVCDKPYEWILNQCNEGDNMAAVPCPDPE
ncbi:MAG: hypothetical protein FH748_15740 [Balneolaceae bacterium]|nr:hypothetical protein [Balneolaceae bacterium]